MRSLIITLTGVLILATLAGKTHGTLVSNGDFELGNEGFSTDYSYSPGSLWIGDATYTVDTDPRNVHGGAASYGDHTTGIGNMLIVNGNSSEDNTFWQQSISVSPGIDYVFSYWLSSWTSGNSAQIGLLINDNQIGIVSAPHAAAEWMEVSHTWNSGSSSQAVISLVDLNNAFAGNDFAVDDIALVPEPGTFILLSLGGIMMLRKRS